MSSGAWPNWLANSQKYAGGSKGRKVPGTTPNGPKSCDASGRSRERSANFSEPASVTKWPGYTRNFADCTNVWAPVIVIFQDLAARAKAWNDLSKWNASCTHFEKPDVTMPRNALPVQSP